MSKALLYGCYGYTGDLVSRAARAAGRELCVAGRDAARTRAIAARDGFEARVFALDDPGALDAGLAGVSVVLHCAGPFARTSRPMVDACLRRGVHYLDITGEIPVFQTTFSFDGPAMERGVCLMSGVGFDVVPTDCMARYVAEQLPDATTLDIAFAAIGRPSAGTAKSALEQLPAGNYVRRDGDLVATSEHAIRTVRFSDRERTVVSIPWGDLETAYRSTGIRNITTWMAQPARVARLVQLGAPVARRLVALPAIRRALSRFVERSVKGPDEAARAAGKSLVWVRATNPRGDEREAWLETVEGYAFTAVSAVKAALRVLEQRPRGALTPSIAFGPDFVLEVEGTRRLDALP